MDLFLYITIAYLVYTSFILIRNFFEFEPLYKSEKYPGKKKKVSICIPARNEADVIEGCITSALKQNYENFEVLVLDDQSTDGTTEIIEKLSSIVSTLRMIKGKPKPDEWLGKPWACHQLSEAASGDVLIFIDADVWLNEDVITKSLTELNSFDSITVWPEQKTETFWEKQVIPLIYFALYTLLPAKYVERSPRWLPSFFAKKLNTAFSAACGQFIAFNRGVYNKIGGHTTVKDQVIEDVELSKRIKASGSTLKMLHGVNSVYCRMYSSGKDVWNGLRKNFFLGFNNNILFFGLMALVHMMVFIMPYVLLIHAFTTNNSDLIILSLIPILMIFLQRAALNFLFKWELYSALTHPVGVLWFQALGIQCIIDFLTDNKVQWKGRKLL